MVALLLQFVVTETKLEAVQASVPWQYARLQDRLRLRVNAGLLCKQTPLPEPFGRTLSRSWASSSSTCWRHAFPCFHASS